MVTYSITSVTTSCVSQIRERKRLSRFNLQQVPKAARFGVVPTHNKQLERTVIRRRVRAACASFHCAHAARWTRGRAAAQLRRYALLSRATFYLTLGCVSSVVVW